MGRESIFLSFELAKLPFFTDGSTIEGVLHIEVRKAEAYIGSLFATLICDERVRGTSNANTLLTEELRGIPRSLDRGTHSFALSVPIGPHSLAGFPPSLSTNAKDLGVYWILEVRSDPSLHLHASEVIPVYPSKPLDLPGMDGPPYEQVTRRVPLLAPLQAGEPHKQRAKFFVMLLGPSYRIPKDGELCEVSVKLHVQIPSTGVFQSPSKSQLGLHIYTAAEDAVVLSMYSVKLVGVTSIRGKPSAYSTDTEIWARELDLTLPRGHANLTSDIADLELPACSGTFDSHLFQQKYELKFTFVFRALHLENLTRWVTVSAPIHVLPASVSLGDSPPPYVG